MSGLEGDHDMRVIQNLPNEGACAPSFSRPIATFYAALGDLYEDGLVILGYAVHTRIDYERSVDHPVDPQGLLAAHVSRAPDCLQVTLLGEAFVGLEHLLVVLDR